MNCREAKAEIALWVGHDLDDDAERILKRHVAHCPGCRQRWRKMRSIHRVLHETAERSVGRRQKSLWPQISNALTQTKSPPPFSIARYRGWVPVLAVAAALLAMVSIVNTLQFGDSPSRHLSWIERSSNNDPASLRRVAVLRSAVPGLWGNEPFIVPDGNPFDMLDDFRQRDRMGTNRPVPNK